MGSRFRNNNNGSPVHNTDSNHYDTRIIANDDASGMVSDGMEELLAAAKKSISLDKTATVGLLVTLFLCCVNPAFFVLVIGFAALKIYVRKTDYIDLDQVVGSPMADSRFEHMVNITRCTRVWMITQTSKVIDKKYSGGASNTVNRVNCKVSAKIPFPFKTKSRCAAFKNNKETLIFLPDRLLVMQGSKVGALSYPDISVSAYTTRFHESQGIPGDAQVVGQTWQYVNKSGGPDRRFSNNRQIPICLYGEVELKSASGLDVDIMFSNPDMY